MANIQGVRQVSGLWNLDSELIWSGAFQRQDWKSVSLRQESAVQVTSWSDRSILDMEGGRRCMVDGARCTEGVYTYNALV